MATLKKLSFVSVDVQDWEGAKKFYGETLGLATAFLNDEMGWAQYGGAEGAQLAISKLREGAAPRAHNGGIIPIFEVDDAYQAIRDLRGKGVRVDDAIVIPQMLAYANFYDPEGNKLQIVGPPPP